jgi:hypothetical protein
VKFKKTPDIFARSMNTIFSGANFLVSAVCIGCLFKFPVKVGVEESIVNALRITDPLFKCYRFLCFYMSGAFTIDSSTLTLTGNLNEHPIYRCTRKTFKL